MKLHIEDVINNLACEIAAYSYEKYQAKIYGLNRCPSEFSEDDIEDKKLLKNLLENSNMCFSCDIEKIKSLT